MRQSWDEYVEGRLAIGGCAMVAIGIVAAVFMIPPMIKKLIEHLGESGLYYLPVVLLIAAGVLAGLVGAKSKVNGKKRLGWVLVFGAVLQIALAVFYFMYHCFGSVLMGATCLVLALLLLLFGWANIVTNDT
ncbi:MAG: hypothetical protein IJN04_04320 [Clostridia bacterium]|nr:hypothetical protein [Clostridia bacterium]